jgi:hypothetical protein
VASQRGDSGTSENSPAVTAETAAPNISAQRQPSTPSGAHGVSQRIKKIIAGAPRKANAAQSIITTPRRDGGSTSAR